MSDLETVLTYLAVLFGSLLVILLLLWLEAWWKDRRMRRPSWETDTQEFDTLADSFGDLQQTSSKRFREQMRNPADPDQT